MVVFVGKSSPFQGPIWDPNGKTEYSPDRKELDVDLIKAIVKKAPEFIQLLSEEKQETFFRLFDQKLESITTSSDSINKYSKVASVKSALFSTLCRCGTPIRQASELAEACMKQYVIEIC